MMLQKSSKRRILMCLSAIGALILISAFVFIGCEDAVDTPPPADTTPPAQSATISNVRVASTSITFDVSNPNEEAVNVTVAVTPAPPEAARIVVDGTATAIAEAVIALTADGTDGARKEGIELTMLANELTYIITLTTADSSGNQQSEKALKTATPRAAPPEDITITPGYREVTLSWNAVEGATQYHIYRATGVSGSFNRDAPPHAEIAHVADADTQMYVDTTDLSDNSIYKYLLVVLDQNAQESSLGAELSVRVAPAIPKDLVAEGKPNAVELKWYPSLGADSYRIYRAIGNDMNTAEPITTNPATLSPFPTSYTDTTATNGVEYSYAIRAVNADGAESANSMSATAIPLAAPDAPQNFIATPGNGAVMLEWDIPTDGSAVSGYRIYRAIGGNIVTAMLLSTMPATLPHTTRSYIDQSVTNTVQYTYTVRAVNANDTESADSNTDTATPRAPAGAPTNLTAESLDGSVRLVWAPPADGGTVTEYRIYRVAGTDINAATRLTTTPRVLSPRTRTYTDSPVTNGAQYTYAVRAVNANDVESGDSNPVTANPLAAPGTPKNFSATPGNGTVMLEWEAPDDDSTVSGYRIYRALGANIVVATLLPTAPATLPPATRDYTDTRVTNNVQYTYIVRAVNANGTESDSSESRSATPRQPAGAPANLTAESLDGSVRLTWNRPASGGAVIGYRIYRAVGSTITDTPTRLAPSSPIASTTRAYTDSPVTNGTQYTYAVRAVNANGIESGNSDTVTANPLAAPGTPKNFSATPGNGTVTLEWETPDDDSTVSGYRIYRTTGATIGTSPLLISGPTPISDTTFSYTDSNVRNGTQYSYTVRAINRNELESANSDEKRATPRAPAGAPDSLTARFGDRRVELTWTVPKSGGTVSGYRIYRAIRSGNFVLLPTVPPTLASTTRTYTDSNLSNGTQYRYVVRAVNESDIDGPDSPVRTGRPLAPPSPPATLTAEAGSDSVTLTWTAPTTNANDVIEYRVYRTVGSTITDTPTRLAATSTIPSTTRTYTDNDATNGTQYTYAVRAVNANGAESANSAVVAAMPLARPNPPASLIAVAGSGSVTLTWAPPVNDSSVREYRIYRATGFDISQATILSTTPDALTRTYTDNTAANGTEYSYAVRAVNTNGTESRNSPVDFATPLAPPNAPTSLDAIAGNGLVTLDWIAAGGGAVTEYRVYRAVGSTITDTPTRLASTSTIPSTTRAYTDNDATNGTEYSYTVRAVNANGAESANSAVVAAMPLARPNPPASLIAVAGSGSVTLTWAPPVNDSSVREYRIYRAMGFDISRATMLSTAPSTLNALTRTYTDNNATDGTEYSYAVRAVNTNGTESRNSPVDFATPLVPPNAPTSLDAIAGNGLVTLSWTAPTVPAGGGAALEYRIYRVAGADINSAINTAVIPATTTTYTDRGLTNGTEYSYAVRAVNANGAESGNSNSDTATPLAAPNAPLSLIANAGNGTVTLNWTAPTIPTGGGAVLEYRIYRVIGTDISAATTHINLSVISPPTLTYTDSGLTNGTQYTYAVRSVNANGTQSANSNTRSATPLLPPNPPTALTATDGDTSVTLRWTAPASGAAVTEYYIYRATGTNINGAIRLNTSSMITDTTYTDRGLTNGTDYTYAVRAVSTNGIESVNSTPASAKPRVVPSNVMAIDDGARVMLSWSAPIGAGITEYYILRTVGRGSEARLATTPAATTAYIDRDVTFGATYHYRIQAVIGSAAGEISARHSVTLSVDRDHDTLIDINNLDMLAHIRYNLAGTSYKTSDSDTGLQCGIDGRTACTGYELMRDLDFAVPSDYASGSVNMAWRPTASSSVVAPDSATNSGWQPIGNSTTPFATRFEGNGYRVRNLYSRNTANIVNARIGLFGQMNASGTLRNLLIEDSNVYGGSMRDNIGIAVGYNSGTIANVAVRGGSVHGGNSNDWVGGLVGESTGSTIASSSTAAVYGDGGNDYVGGLVGENFGTVTASYASGAVDGGTGGNDRVGGLVGRNGGTIRASYATGNVNANAGDNEGAGGLVGLHGGSASATIIASYATGNVDGGTGTGDRVGKLFGITGGTITASYGFGTTSGGEIAGNDGSTLPSGVTTATQLTAPGSAVATAVPAEWNQASSHTRHAWSFGTNSQTPALRYADYDNAGRSIDYCASFSSHVPGTTNTLICGVTFLPGQNRAAVSLSPFDLTIPLIHSDSFVLRNNQFTLRATVENAPGSRPASAATLTYYRSTDDTVSIASDTSIGTDVISILGAGVADTQDITITLTTIGTYYYYACVRSSEFETDTGNNCSDVVATEVIYPIDSDNDRLIDIRNLDMLNNIRYNIRGTSYKGKETDGGIRCGTGSTTTCIGYELMRDLDFAAASSYANGRVNMAWRPTAGGSIVAPGSATNSGWQPIGTSNSVSFATLFEGNGYKISNLYSRNVANTNGGRTGLFGQLGHGTLRNLLIEDSNVYGGNNSDNIGIVAGFSRGEINNVAVRGGSARGGNGNDNVGGLAGFSNGTIVASASTAAVYGNDGVDDVGGLVGEVVFDTVTASYATGAVDGGGGNSDDVGGLVGRNIGTIRASYATGNVNTNSGNNEYAGGLVGAQDTRATIIASYATGNVDGGTGAGDRVGRLLGDTTGTITASYGFGTTSGGETAGHDGSALPSGVIGPSQLTVPGSAVATATPAQWNQASSYTLNAWDFGTSTQFPTLRYADYDGSSGTDYCASFSTHIPGTSMVIACGTTLLSGQEALRSVPPFDLTVSATFSTNAVSPNTSVTLTAIVRNRQRTLPSTATTLTYYRSADNVRRSPATDTVVGTDSIPALNGGVTSTQNIAVTAPATVGNYYHYACVTTKANEANTLNNCSSVIAIQVISSIDSDGDRLIDIQNLDMLNNIRHNLAGTSYKTSAGDSGQQCGTGGTTACIGYELMRDLDFAVAGSYASGNVNMEWRPTAGGRIVAPGSATNSGWQPVGAGGALAFATLFEGNGRSISNLYSRNTANTNNGRTGLFGQLSTSATLRNLRIEDGNVYGGSRNDDIGIAVGYNQGTIANVAVRGGSAHGSNGFDYVGGLVGQSTGTIVASSSSTTTAYGDNGSDYVGGLVGRVTGGSVTASYASGAVDGGTGSIDRVGGLAGFNSGTIRASYATGNVNANIGDHEYAGGLVGSSSGTVIASYATGNVDGGTGGGDRVGKLLGNFGTITASYGFGTTSGGEIGGNNGTALPSGVTTPHQFTAPGSTSTTAVPAQWNQMSSSTLNAWHFGTGAQAPALRYADYDGGGGTDYCAMFTNIPGTSTAIVCGTTLLPGQADLRLLPPDLTVSATSTTNTALPNTSITLTATVRNRQHALSSTATTLRYYRSTDNVVSTVNDTAIGTDTIPILSGGATSTQNIIITTPATLGTYYYYACVAAGANEADTTNNCSSVVTVRVINPIDRDNDKLIDIQNLNMLDHIRYNLAGTSYKTSTGDSGMQCGVDGTTACIGYELMRDLDFAVAGDYASGSVNMAWRSTASNRIVAPDSATNRGWQPIGNNTTPFSTLFEGNGYKIDNLYSRNTVNTNDSRFGLFGQVRSNGTLRNLLMENGNLYGGDNTDNIGIVVGVNSGTIANVAVRGGSAHGGNGTDDIGGLVGQSTGTIIASSSSALVYGDGSAEDDVGGLIGRVNGGSVTASYASGAVDGGKGNSDHVGGLVGNNGGTIRASYATGNVNSNNGGNEAAGGLVGLQSASATIIASYATGNIDGGLGVNDRVGRLLGSTLGTITASYGFGTTSGGEAVGHDGTALPSGVTTPHQFTAPGSAATTAAPAQWNQMNSSTLNAWHFGTGAQAPALRYADYDGGGGTDYCSYFTNIPGTNTRIVCGTTLLPGQGTLRLLPPDLTVSATFTANTAFTNTSVTLNATVRNRQHALTSTTGATLTYYRSADNVVSTVTDTVIGTDTIPTLSGGATSTQNVTVTVPATIGTHYYYACVAAGVNEVDTNNNCSSVIPIQVTSLDSDGDKLIDIHNLDMFNNIRYNLAGTSYKTSAGDSGRQCGADGTTACVGYELMRDLDFAVASDYASGRVNMDWRPTASSRIVAPGSATNSGWQPIGAGGALAFATLFEGNGRSISNLYSRNLVHTGAGRIGLFGQTDQIGTLRNLRIENSNVYGGNSFDYIGIAVGRNQGTIVNVAVRGGSAHGGKGNDRIGGLVGFNGRGIIIASSSTAAVYGNNGFDDVGGLAGWNGRGSVTASYATGTVDGGAGTSSIGGLLGGNENTVRASYATGNVNASAGAVNGAGGLVGQQGSSATIIASYATGNINGGAGGSDRVGKLLGDTNGTITASYAFGTTSGGEIVGHNGTALPSGVTMARQLTAPGSATTTAVPAQWNQMTSDTLNAWDFGNNSQAPALRYADYDGAGGVDYCAYFGNIPGTNTKITCGTTLLPGQR